jgi:hypothetical protein
MYLVNNEPSRSRLVISRDVDSLVTAIFKGLVKNIKVFYWNATGSKEHY